MQLQDFDYQLPKELIAQTPAIPRDYSRLLVLHRQKGEIEHDYFYSLINHLKKGDVLVLNNTKVFPARLIGKKRETGGKIEVFLLAPTVKGGNIWQCLTTGGGKESLTIDFNSDLQGRITSNNQDGTWNVKFNKRAAELMAIVDKIGLVPLPPYIKRSKQKISDKKTYQTVFAEDKKIGSVAAPTAGLHFTPSLINQLKKKGVQLEYITLHVGLGTFASVKTENINEHKMHSEWIEVNGKTLKKIIEAKKEARRIIAVGTTAVRSLETIYSSAYLPSKNRAWKGWTDIFIHPGYKFKIVDAMITNFHVPKSTLLMLVSAFTGEKDKDVKSGIIKIKKAYAEAIKNKYRFFSYGDAMLID